MALEKTPQSRFDRAQMIEVRDTLGGCFTIKAPSPAKYRAEKRSKIQNAPDLVVGRPLVARVLKHDKLNEVAGYLLGELIDFHDNGGWWSERTAIIFRVTDASTEALREEHVGRVRSAYYECEGELNPYFQHGISVIHLGIGLTYRNLFPTLNTIV